MSKHIRANGKGPVAVVVVFFLVLLTACASRGKIKDFYLNPSDGDRAVFTHEGVTISSEYYDEETRGQYLRKSGREAFARITREMDLTAFLLEIVNKNSSEVIVDSVSIRFITGIGPTLRPVTYADMYMALPREAGRQTALQELNGITFDRPVTIPPGGREEGLIFFQRPEEVARDVALFVGGIYLGGAHFDAALAFKAVSMEK